MGCDIHAHVEVKINGEWHHYNHPNVDRSYALFGRMAGVRDASQDPISEPRGLPADATRITQFDYEHWNGDAHSASWLTAEEVASLEEWAQERGFERVGFYSESKFGFVFGNSWEFRKYDFGGYPAGFEDARLVFWFDN